MSEAERDLEDSHSERNMPAATVVGISLGAALIGAGYLSPVLLLIFVQVFLTIALLELDQAFDDHESQPPTLIAILSMPLAFFGGWWLGEVGLLMGLLLSVFVGCLAVIQTSRRGRGTRRLGQYFLMVLWVPFLASFMTLVMRLDHGVTAALGIVGTVVAHDIAAFFVGKNFGRHKLAANISPSKTWEGMIGGLVSATTIAAIAFPWINTDINIGEAAIIGTGVALSAVVGDLFESMIKRDLNIKDLGTILPGHGGVMDRIDAHLWAMPVGWLLLTITG